MLNYKRTDLYLYAKFSILNIRKLAKQDFNAMQS